MAFGLEGSLVRLVPLDWDRHGENAYRWVNDPEVTEFLLIGDRPLMRDAEREFFQRMAKSETDVLFAIETLDGRHVGMSGLHGIDVQNGTATTGTFIGEVSDRGQGYGRESAALRTAYAFETLGLRLLYSAYQVGNDRSRRMQESVGYKAWGTRERAYWKRGRYIDLVETRLFAEEWRENQPASTSVRER
jgi:RimJ/RimL family protein N-acetyltransferase